MKIKIFSVALVCFLSANAMSDIRLKAGEWESESTSWLDGVKFSLDDIERNMLEKMSSAERSAYEQAKGKDSNETNKEFSCSEETEIGLKPREYAEQLVKAGAGAVFNCSLDNGVAIQSEHRFHFVCTTRLGAKAEGDVKFSFLEKSYKSEVVSKGHMIDSTTGKPLSPKIVTSRLVSTGRWLSDQCTHSSVEDDNDGGD